MNDFPKNQATSGHMLPSLLTPKNHLDAYCNLIFSPLALPPPPVLDNAALTEWIEWGHMEGRKIGLNYRERNYEGRTGRQYPWLKANVTFSKPNEVSRSFEQKFPHVVEYCRLFPVKRLGSLVLITQRGGMDVHMHADSDGYWGLRFYLANKNYEGLQFYFARPGIDALPRGTDELPQHVEAKKHYARWPAENRPYCVNSLRAAHAVDRNTCALGERIACLLFPEGGYDDEKLLALLQASSAKFSKYQIWRED